MNISTRRWTRADLATVQQLLLETWLEAYGSFIPQTDLEGYLHTQYSEARLAALFADPDVTGLVAEVDGRVAGYAKLFHARAELKFYVHQLYILPAWQGHGLGHRLMTCAEERARELGATVALAARGNLGGTCTNDACPPTRVSPKPPRLRRDIPHFGATGPSVPIPVADFGPLTPRPPPGIHKHHTKSQFLRPHNAPDQPAKTLGFYLLSPAVTLGKAQADSRY